MNFKRTTALVGLALALCYCTGGGSGSDSTSGSPCPLTQFTARALVDGNPAVGLNVGSDSADAPAFAELNGKIYVGWSEFITVDGTDEVQVSVYNGNDSAPGWTRVVGAANGLNKSTSSAALNIKLAASNGKLYATWVEDAAGPSVQLRAAVYNGNDSAPSWAFVDGGGATGLNKNPARFAFDPQLVEFNAKLYLVWSETNAGLVPQIRVAVYGGDDSVPVWTFVDGNGANGINKSTARGAESPTVAVYNSRLYLAWRESNGTNDQVRAVVYGANDSAPVWTFIDGNGANGINYSSAQNASGLRLAANTRDMMLYWVENSAVRARAYGGVDSSPNWYVYDSGAAGLSAGAAVESAPPAGIMLGYHIMTGWMEPLSGSKSLHLAYYSGGWSFLASSATANLNVDPTMDAFRPAALVTSSCKVYVGWVETDNALGTNLLHTAVLR